MADSRIVQLDTDLPITLDEAGNGRPALVLHGGGGPATVAGIAAHLTDTMHVITPTHPGWNGTDRPERLKTIVDLAGDYLRLLAAEDLRDVLPWWVHRSAAGSPPRWPSRTETTGSAASYLSTPSG